MTFDFYDKAPKEIVSTCNLCGGHRFVLVNLKDRYGLEAPTVRCQDCGLVFLSFRMTADAYAEFYRDGHYRELFAKWLGKRPEELRVRADQSHYADALVLALDPHMGPYRSGLLLDVGGSVGAVADRMAHEYDLDVTVIEPALAEAQRARDRGLTVYPVPLEQYSPNGNRYDVVLLCRSVDHLLDVKGALARIRSWMRPGALFFVDFMAVRGEYKIDHPYYFNLRTMGRFLEATGFKPMKYLRGLDHRHVSLIAEAA